MIEIIKGSLVLNCPYCGKENVCGEPAMFSNTAWHRDFCTSCGKYAYAQFVERKIFYAKPEEQNEDIH